MIAASRFGQPARRGERVFAIILVALIHVGLAFALLAGFRVRLDPQAESPLHLIDLKLVPPPPPLVPPPPPPPRKPDHEQASARAAVVAPPGGSETPAKPNIPAPVTPSPKIVLPVASVASGGGQAGQGGAAAGPGAGGGQGGNGDGTGDGGGGSDLVQIAGAIGPRDYPRSLRDSGVGGRVLMTFTVAPNGRVSRCVVTRSSGVPELDELTCRLIRERFFFRPETDRNGRAIATEVDGEHLWTARARD